MRCANRLISLLVLTLTLYIILVSAQNANQVPFEAPQSDESTTSKTSSAADYLKQGTAAMSTGRFADAITHFNEAITLDPDNYLTYYRRATAALSIGRTSSASSDFDKIIQLNPKFAQAYLQKAKLITKEGKFDNARESIDQYIKLKKDDDEAKELKKSIEAASANFKLLRKAKESIDKSLTSGKNITTDKSMPSKVDDCMRLASLILEVSPSLLEVRKDRADCALAKGEYADAIADWT